MKFLCHLVFLFSIFISFAQQTSLVSVHGHILEEATNTPMEYATISFKNQKNDSIVLGGLSNSKGKFAVSIAKGNYQVTIEYLGFQPKIIPLQLNSTVSLGSIFLTPLNEQLDEVLISNHKSIRLNKGKISLITAKDASSKGNNALEILNNLPSVHTSNTGIVTVDGFKEATILINGKKSALSKSEILKTISSASIKRIDVISHPGAQYRANEQAIVNIILKRGKNKGLHGSVTTTAGYKDLFGVLVNVHHKTENVNFYTNISASRKKDFLESTYQNEYYISNGEVQSYLDQEINYDNRKDTYFANFGAEFKLSKRTNLYADVNLYSIQSDALIESQSTFIPTNNLIPSFNVLEKSNDYEDFIFEAQLNLEHHFRNNANFTLDILQTLDKESYNNKFSNSNPNLEIANTLDENYLKNTQVSSKYSQALSKTATLTFGYDGEFGSSPFDHYSQAGDYIIKHEETVHAGFVEYEYEKDSWYVGMGVRAEFFNIETNFVTDDLIQKRNYDDLFPVVYIQKELNDNSNIIFDYNTKISRPSLYKIQPFNQVTSETSYFSGNPNLAPFYMDNYAITYTYSKSNFTIRPSIKYSKFKDAWRDVTYETGIQINGVSTLVTKPFNVGDTDYFVANITALYRVTNRLNFTFNSNLMHLVNRGVFTTINTIDTPISIDYNHKNTNADFSLITRLNLAKGFTIQNRLYHRLDSKGPVSERTNYSYATLSISKEIWKNNGTISFTSNDLFNSNRTRRTYFNNYYSSEARIKNRYPTYLLSLTYRFNQRKNRQKINFTKKDQKPQF